MSRASRAATALGVAAAVVGLAMAGGATVRGLSLGYLFVTLVGVFAFLQGARYVVERRHADVRAAETGDPEVRQRLPTPGDDFDADAFGSGGVRYSTRRRLRDRLREAAVETLAVRGECAPAAARERLDDGTWTDDAVAANFLGADVPRLALRHRIRLWVRRESALSFRVRRSVDAVAALHDAGGPSGASGREGGAGGETGADADPDSPAAREGSP